MKPSTQLIIFDCDGTLVDTEALSARSTSGVLQRYGVTITPEDFRDEFTGVALQNIMRVLEARFGVALPFDELRDQVVDVMMGGLEREMQVLPASVEVVHRLASRVQVAVGSNGMRPLVLAEVARAGYGDILPEAQIFTASQVASPKPAPDLFLYAAERMGVAPEACMVVEDSVAGAAAGVAAGMRVVGYTGFAHDVAGTDQVLENAGCFEVIHDLSQLERLVL